MAQSITMKLALLSLFCASALAAVPEHKFKLPEDRIALSNRLRELDAMPRRSALTVPETDALVFATPQNDNNDGVLPLFDPSDLLPVLEANPNATACKVIAAVDYCVGDFSRLFKAICPISCEEDPALFCKQDDELASQYAGYINLKLDMTSCATMATSKVPIVQPDNKEFLFCEHPMLGLMCADTCNINCWSWPPPITTKAFLPGCMESVAVPKEYYKAMLKNTASPGDSTICPPPYLD